jgi:hypothetical protein
MAMKGSLAAVVGLLVVTFAYCVGQAEAQHRGGKAKPAEPHAPKAGPQPGVGKAHPAQPKHRAQPKSKGAMPKAAVKKEQDSPKKKQEAKKELAHKKEAKKAGADHDQESISLLHAVYQKLHEADHDYDGHRLEAMRHTGAALGHQRLLRTGRHPVRKWQHAAAEIGRHLAGGQDEFTDDRQPARFRDRQGLASW